MEFKFLLVLIVVGVAAGFTVPNTEPEATDLESSFPSSHTHDKLSPVREAELSPEESVRDKRHLFKKYKKGGETIVVNRNYEQQTGIVGTGHYKQREVHHHHYSNPRPVEGPTYVERPIPVPVPSNEYHHYHGYQNQGAYQNQGDYYSGNSGSYGGAYSSGSTYYQKPSYTYGEGGYGQYGGAGGYSAPPTHLAAPIAGAHNNVDRGQGAAAVNNIAIIHARSGSSSSSSASSSSASSGSNTLPRGLPVDVDGILSRQGYGIDSK